MKLILVFILATSCSLTRFSGEETEEIAPPPPRPLLWNKWYCCKNQCKGRNKVMSVVQEDDSDFIVCVCRDGSVFKLLKLKSAK